MWILATWPTYGTWLAGPAHGRIELCRGENWSLPEPDERSSRTRQLGLKWPVVYLDDSQRDVVRKDLARIASIRQFAIEHVIVAPDHVHVLLVSDQLPSDPAAAGDPRLLRLVQLIKGATSRALSVAVGDQLPRDAHGRELPHYKWWTRQHSAQVLADQMAIETARQRLHEHH